MTARDDLTRATGEARAQVRSARDALASTRASRAGGAAKDVAQAEQQLGALRGAVAADLRVLKDRATGLDAAGRRGATLAAVAGIGMLATVVGTGLAVRRGVRRSVSRRAVQQQARAIAAELARQAADAADGSAGAGSRASGRRGRRGLVIALAVGAAVAGATALQQRRSGPVHPEDLWLPDLEPGTGDSTV